MESSYGSQVSNAFNIVAYPKQLSMQVQTATRAKIAVNSTYTEALLSFQEFSKQLVQFLGAEWLNLVRTWKKFLFCIIYILYYFIR
jgi:hypothetical protein